MNGQQLKNSILQWAIQGKLVPQDPSEGTAEDLLKDIRAEKEQLVKDGKLKKKDLVSSNIYKGADGKWYETIGKETTEITDDIPFEIPDGWRWSRLKTCFFMQAGKNIKADEIFQETSGKNKYKCYGGNGIRGYVNRYNHSGFFPIIGRQGALCGNVNLAKGDFYATEHAVPVHTYANTDVLCCYYFLIALNLNQYATATAQPGIAVSNIENALIPIPPLPEQRRIVAKIEELMPLVEKYGKSQEKLDKLNEAIYSQLEKSILQEAIQGKLVPQLAEEGTAEQLLSDIRAEKERLVKEGKLSKKDLVTSNIYKEDDKWFETTGKETKDITDEIPFDVPEGWKWLRFSHFSYIYTGNSINENEKASKYTKVKGMEYIGTKDVEFNHTINYQNGVCIPDSYIGNFRVAPSESILMCIEGGSAGRKIAKLSKDVCFGNKLCCFNPYVKVHDFIYYYLQTALFREVFQSNKTGIIGGVSVNTIKTLLVPLPPLAEQHRIVSKIEELMNVIKK